MLGQTLSGNLKTQKIRQRQQIEPKPLQFDNASRKNQPLRTELKFRHFFELLFLLLSFLSNL